MFEILLKTSVCIRHLQMIPDQEVPSLGNPAPVQPCLFSRGKHLRRRGGGISPWTELFVFLSRSLQGGLLPKRRSSVQAGEKAGFSFKEARRPLGLCDDNSGVRRQSLARSLAQLQIPSIPSQIPDGEIAMRPESAFMGKHGWTNCYIAIRPTTTVVLDRGCVASKCDRYYARSCRRPS